MTKVFTIVLSFILVLNTSAQETSKDVSITASGSGASMEEAQQSALRSATEQAFGAFISSKTEIFNDQLVADQISSVSSGNIKSFDILNQAVLPDGRWGCTLKAIVSVDKLTSFVQAKGIAIEIKGGLFALNIKQQLLNEQGEVEAIADMIGLLHESMQTSFDYVIHSSDPKALDAESKNWEIPLEVIATCNKNMDFCSSYFNKTLSALSLSDSEVETYKSLNKSVLPLRVFASGKESIFFLRKELSIEIIKSFTRNWDFYTSLFSISDGTDQLNGISRWNFSKNTEFKDHEFTNYFEDFTAVKDINLIIYFPSNGQKIASFRGNEKKTLHQIEQMTGYEVKPTGIVSHFRHGGFVVQESNGHGFVLMIVDLDRSETQANADVICNDLVINGYNDWRLPTIDELENIHKNIFKLGIGNITEHAYWSSTIREDKKLKLNGPLVFSMSHGIWTWDMKWGQGLKLVRAVRSF